MDAGWYDDPFGRFVQRYFDGTSWTAHVSSGDGVSFTDPSGSVAQITGGLPASPAQYGYPAPPAGPALASPWIRLAARILDAVVVSFPATLLATLLFGEVVTIDGDVITYNWGALIFVGAISAAYEIGMVGWRGQTLGKMATHIEVARKSDGSLPGYGVAAIRWAASVIPGLIPFIGAIIQIASIVMIFADSHRQMIHDKLASTIVVKARP